MVGEWDMNDRRREVIASGRELEDSFFLKQDRDLIDKLKTLRRLEETRDALAEASGIRDQAVLQKLVELGVRPESVAPLALVPIVEVAWADGKVDEKERQAVLEAADARGIRAGDLQHGLLHSWLSHRPSTKLLQAWQHYVAGLCAQLDEEQRNALRGELLDRARAVAEASGGFLGLGSKVSPSERAVLKRLEAAFAVAG
jgi:uncharacterized tellurite resistance protein B-like protein